MNIARVFKAAFMFFAHHNGSTKKCLKNSQLKILDFCIIFFKKTFVVNLIIGESIHLLLKLKKELKHYLTRFTTATFQQPKNTNLTAITRRDFIVETIGWQATNFALGWRLRGPIWNYYRFFF